MKHARSEVNLQYSKDQNHQEYDEKRLEERRVRHSELSRRDTTKSVDYNAQVSSGSKRHHNHHETIGKTGRSKSTDNVFEASQSSDPAVISLDSNTLKKMLNPLPSSSSNKSSPEDQNVIKVESEADMALRREREREIFKEAWRIAPPATKALSDRRAQLLSHPELLRYSMDKVCYGLPKSLPDFI